MTSNILNSSNQSILFSAMVESKNSSDIISRLWDPNDSGFSTIHWQMAAVAAFQRGEAKRSVVYGLRAESKASGAMDWLDCSDVWVFLEDSNAVSRCMAKAELESSTGLDWGECAKKWHGLEKLEATRRCMGEAEALAYDSADWGMCAATWIRIGEGAETIRCLVKAEDLARSRFDWENCAELWAELGNLHRAKRCLIKRAGSMAV